MKHNAKLTSRTLAALMLITGTITGSLAQGSETSGQLPAPRHYLGTSLFVLSSLIPDDNTYFMELDYGYKLNARNDLIIGANIYKYASPMSTPWSESTEYPGTVLSYGVVAAFQHYIYRGLFIDQMINPLVLEYNHADGRPGEKGFMLLLATRIGYHLDFNMFRKHFYLEAGGEVSYWPVNRNVPEDFRMLDDLYRSFVFSPALQFGIQF